MGTGEVMAFIDSAWLAQHWLHYKTRTDGDMYARGWFIDISYILKMNRENRWIEKEVLV